LKILLIEYATLTEDSEIITEGYMILKTLSHSFYSIDQDVYYVSQKGGMDGIKGESIYLKGDISDFLEKIARNYDAALVIAPERDNILYSLTSIIEDSTTNLGSPPEAIKLCSDKLTTTNILINKGIKTPSLIERDKDDQDTNTKFILKPRFGCGSEGVRLIENGYLSKNKIKDDEILVEYIDGRHISSSLIVGEEKTLFLTLNEQLINFNNFNKEITYLGGIVPYKTRSKKEWDKIMRISIDAAESMGCRGYVGIDFVVSNLSNEPYVVDINSRLTTSIVGINRVINYELAYLLLKSKFNPAMLPSAIKINGICKFLLSDAADQKFV